MQIALALAIVFSPFRESYVVYKLELERGLV